MFARFILDKLTGLSGYELSANLFRWYIGDRLHNALLHAMTFPEKCLVIHECSLIHHNKAWGQRLIHRVHNALCTHHSPHNECTCCEYKFGSPETILIGKVAFTTSQYSSSVRSYPEMTAMVYEGIVTYALTVSRHFTDFELFKEGYIDLPCFHYSGFPWVLLQT